VGAAGTTTAGTQTLAYNRFVQIEPAPDYNEGMVTFSLPFIAAPGDFSTPYFNNAATVYPLVYPPLPGIGTVLMIEEAPFANNDGVTLNSPTSWYWNIRVGDKIRFGDSGAYYTVVGPLTVNPFNARTPGQNPELFVNVGLPGTLSPLTRTYAGTVGNPEFLFLVNGQDDNGNGYADEGFDGVDNDGLNGFDDVLEWEDEKWVGPQGAIAQTIITTYATSGLLTFSPPQKYTIARRPVVSQGAREINLPQNVVIDATSLLLLNTTSNSAYINPAPERSRLPIDPITLNVDIMLNPSGELIPTTVYSTPTSFTMDQNFLHFWIAERGDVHAVTELWGGTIAPNPNLNAGAGATFLLPLPADVYAAANPALMTPLPQLSLTGDRRLITLFARTGLITTHTVENFSAYNINLPFFEAQNGGIEEP